MSTHRISQDEANLSSRNLRIEPLYDSVAHLPCCVDCGGPQCAFAFPLTHRDENLPKSSAKQPEWEPDSLDDRYEHSYDMQDVTKSGSVGTDHSDDWFRQY